MTIYIDDSGTSPENAVAVAAGWIAHTDSWVDFQADWDKARDIDGDKFDSMHMAEFVFGGKGTEFEGWSLEEKQRKTSMSLFLTRSECRVLKATTHMPFAVCSA